MAKSNINMTGLPHTSPRIDKNGNAILMFKIPSHKPISNGKDHFNQNSS